MHIPRVTAALLVVLALTVGACGKKQPPVARPVPPPPTDSSGSIDRPPTPPEPIAEKTSVPPEPIAEDPLKVSDIDKINQNSPFQPVFFAYDMAEIDTAGQTALNANAAVLK